MPRFTKINSFDEFGSKKKSIRINEIYDLTEEGSSSIPFTIDSILGTDSSSGSTWNAITGNSVYLSVNYSDFKSFSHLGSAYSRTAVGLDRVRDRYPNGVILSAVSQYTFPSQSIIAGRVALPDIIAGSNWYDTTAGNINTNVDGTTPTDSDLELIANGGFAYIGFSRVATKTGRAKLEKLREYNPNFEYAVYVEFSSHPTVNPGFELILPWNTWQNQNLEPARSVDGTKFMRNSFGTAWVNFMSDATPGYTFNKTVIDSLIDKFMEYWNQLPYLPIAIKFDYFNNTNVGYFNYSGGSPLDLDQDGTVYTSDAEEQQSLKDTQEYYVQAFREAVGPDIILFANGNAVQPVVSSEPDLKALLNGPFFEGFPENTVYGIELNEYMSYIHSQYTGTSDWKAFGDKTFMFMTGVQPSWAINTGSTSAQTVINVSRCAALMYDGWYRYDVQSPGIGWDSGEILDTGFTSLKQTLGNPVGDPTFTVVGGTTHIYEREFVGGTAKISLDVSTTGLDQILFAGIS